MSPFSVFRFPFFGDYSQDDGYGRQKSRALPRVAGGSPAARSSHESEPGRHSGTFCGCDSEARGKAGLSLRSDTTVHNDDFCWDEAGGNEIAMPLTCFHPSRARL